MEGICLEESIANDGQEQQTPCKIVPFYSMNPLLGKSQQQCEAEYLNSNSIVQEEDQSKKNQIKQDERSETNFQVESQGQESSDYDQSMKAAGKSYEPETTNQDSINGTPQDKNIEEKYPFIKQCEQKNAYKSIGADFSKKIFHNQEFQMIIRNSITNIKEFKTWVGRDLKCFVSKEMFKKAFLGRDTDYQQNFGIILNFRKLLTELAFQYFNNEIYAKKYLNESKKMHNDKKILYGKLIYHFQQGVNNPAYFNQRWNMNDKI